MEHANTQERADQMKAKRAALASKTEHCGLPANTANILKRMIFYAHYDTWTLQCSQKAIASWVEVSPPTVTRAVARLQQLGLIEAYRIDGRKGWRIRIEKLTALHQTRRDSISARSSSRAANLSESTPGSYSLDADRDPHKLRDTANPQRSAPHQPEPAQPSTRAAQRPQTPAFQPPTGAGDGDGIWIYLPGSAHATQLLPLLERLTVLLSGSPSTSLPRSDSRVSVNHAPNAASERAAKKAVIVAQPLSDHAPKLKNMKMAVKFSAAEISFCPAKKFHSEMHQSLPRGDISSSGSTDLSMFPTPYNHILSSSSQKSEQNEIKHGPAGLPNETEIETNQSITTARMEAPSLRSGDKCLVPIGTLQPAAEASILTQEDSQVPLITMPTLQPNPNDSTQSALHSDGLYKEEIPGHAQDVPFDDGPDMDIESHSSEQVEVPTGLNQLITRTAKSSQAADLARRFCQIVLAYSNQSDSPWAIHKPDQRMILRFLSALPGWQDSGLQLHAVLDEWENYVRQRIHAGRTVLPPQQSLERQVQFALQYQSKSRRSAPTQSDQQVIPDGTIGWSGEHPFVRLQGQNYSIHRPYDTYRELASRLLPSMTLVTREEWESSLHRREQPAPRMQSVHSPLSC